MTPLQCIRQTVRQTHRPSGKRGDREEGETGREVSSTGEGEMWEQEGGEIMLVAPLYVHVCMCVHCTHVSGYAAHRKQTAAKIHFPTHIHRNHHTQGQQRKTQKHTDMNIHTHTQNPTELVPNAPLCSQMSCTHIHTQHTSFTLQTHVPPPT